MVAHRPAPGLAWHADPDEPVDLEVLVERAKAGCPEAFGELFDLFHGPVFRQLLAQTRNRALAEDLTAETFFKALRAVTSFTLHHRLFGAWVRRIARNLAADHYKANRTRLELVTGELSHFEGHVASPEDLLMESFEHDSVRDALRLLPVNQRRVVVARFLLQLSVTETAAEVGCTEGAAKQLQLRGLRNLARLLDDGPRP